MTQFDIELALSTLKHYVNSYDTQLGWKEYTEETFMKDMVYGVGISIDEKYTYKDGFELFLKKLSAPKIGNGYVAIPEYQFTPFDKAGKICDNEHRYIQWWITLKEFWEKYECINDVTLALNIPDFDEDMESCFSYQPEYPCDDAVKQATILHNMGFEILPLGTIET